MLNDITMSNRKSEIKARAARLFRKRGYQATSMREIADAVGIKASSIYNHIDSKQDLLAEMLLFLAEAFTAEMDRVSASGLSADAKLRELIRHHIEMVVHHTDAMALIAGEWVHLDQPAKKTYIQQRDRYEAQFLSIVQEGRQEGLFADIDAEIILFNTLSTLRWLYSWYSRNPDYDVARLQQQMTDCLMGGYLRGVD